MIRAFVSLVLMFGTWLGGALVVLTVVAFVTASSLAWSFLGATVVLALVIAVCWTAEHRRPQVLRS